MPAGPIQAVLFDFYNTLGCDVYPDDCVAARVLAEFGYHVDAARVQAAQAHASGWIDLPDGVDHREHSASREHYNRYQLATHAVWMRGLGVDPEHPGMFERMTDEWDRPDRIRLFD